MAKAQKNTASVVRELILPTVEGLGLRLWDVEFVKEGSEWYLRITIDSDNGIDINDCEAVHRAVDPLLDEADPIEQSYRLEVSSPGIERVIRTPEHIRLCMGQTVCAKLYTARNGAKNIVGTLSGYEEAAQKITLHTSDGADVELELSQISRMNTVFDFDNETV